LVVLDPTSDQGVKDENLRDYLDPILPVKEMHHHYHACYLNNAAGDSVEEEGQVKIMIALYLHYNPRKNDK